MRRGRRGDIHFPAFGPGTGPARRRFRSGGPPRPPGEWYRFGSHAWSAIILGAVGLVCAPVFILDLLTCTGAAIGFAMGVVAVVNTRSRPGLIGILLCVAAVVLTAVLWSTGAALPSDGNTAAPSPPAPGNAVFSGPG
jgi:hypothetical protein